MPWMKRDEQPCTWESLVGKIAPEVIHAPKTGGDPTGEWPSVHERIVGYLMRNVVGSPWANHLALVAAVLSARRRDVQTVSLAVRTLHARFSDLFPQLDLKTMQDWIPDLYISRYFKGELVSEDSLNMRQTFLKRYSGSANLVAHWLETLPFTEQACYRPFLLPPVNPLVVEALDESKELKEQQQQHRKNETEAVVPHFADLRAEAHFRYNRLTRLRQAYREALKKVLPDHSNLPLEFSYDEGDPPAERLHCKLWDRRSFALAPEHSYTPDQRYRARRGIRAYSSEHDEIFLEFLNAERLNDDGPAEGFWFTDLLKLSVLGAKARASKNDQVITARQAWLRQWGYAQENTKERVSPFVTGIAGLLTWPDEKISKGHSLGEFISAAQKRTSGALVPVESLYAAATFGLLALDLLTTTGLRSSELMQVNVSPDCIVRLVDDPPPGAKDKSPRIRYLLRLLPKGERTETRHHYGIGKESMRLIERTAQMLCEHYDLQPGETLPRVAFDPTHSRSHRFEKTTVPYLFQYKHQHLSDTAVTSCLRFLIHGMIFQTSQGTPVVLKPHLLRHAFATFAVQVEGLPIDLVAEWLKQKNLETTRYYSQKGQQEVAEEHASFVARLATQINIREAIMRSPEEIQKQAEMARRRIGTLVPVCGGDCTFDGFCHNQFDCIRCPSKAPDPEKRSQVEEKQRWAKERLAYYEQEGLVLEAEKMKQLLRGCELELREMDMMAAYRKDESRCALIQIQPRKRS